ncbi:hypothetical protein [Virgisporangium aliadipatigenens]|uniref:hypothetical protein n=1 Tax=Virgisporangium aliadipatigenens TaxID=741659 RepID=UPI001EF29BBD|nr:hypothetical protein [Virgisporangium aliadipatigenens]
MLLLEADPSGGVVAARFGVAQQPGLASLAAAMRHGGEVTTADHVQHLGLGVTAVVGPGSAETATGAVAVLSAHADTTVAALAPAVIVDVGRLFPGTPAGGLLAAADVVLLAVSPTMEALDHADSRISALRDAAPGARFGLLVAGKGPFPVDEVGDRLDVAVQAELPRDRWGAGVLAGRLTGRGWRRTRLARALHDTVTALEAETHAPMDVAS